MTELATTARVERMLRFSRSRGISLITAIFLVVVLAGLAAGMVRLLSSQQASLGIDAAGVQADQAAHSGLEWGLYQQLRNPPALAACIPNSTFAMPSNGKLAGFTVTVTCVAGANVVGNTTNRWTITSVACNRPGPSGCPNASPDPDYVQRRVRAELN